MNPEPVDRAGTDVLLRDVAVIIPCFNEERSIGEVVHAFRAALPDARIYVFDNNSTDETVAAAAAAGASVRRETLQGKGNVVRRMFADVDADAYVMADGDSTYDPGYAASMVGRLFDERLDMVVGTRLASQVAAYRTGHRFGNRLLTFAVANLFGKRFSDILSGYRVFSRRFVKSFPAMSSGFEIETELTIHALETPTAGRRGRHTLPDPHDRLHEQAAHLRGRNEDPSPDNGSLQERTAPQVLFRDRRGAPRHRSGPRRPAGRYLHPDGLGAASTDGHSGDRLGSLVRSEPRMRIDSRHGHQGSTGDAPARLPVRAAPGRVRCAIG